VGRNPFREACEEYILGRVEKLANISLWIPVTSTGMTEGIKAPDNEKA
jgi:hypothetical protein